MIRTGLIWTAILIGAMFATAFWVRLGIGDAESVPIHWNAAGEADGFASPSGAMVVYWILIGTAVLLGGLFALLPMIDALKEDLLKIRKFYLSIWLGTLGLLLVITAVVGWITYASVVRDTSPDIVLWMSGLTRGVLAASSVGLIALGNHLPKTRQNSVIGIRTPRTLSDIENWERTHRYAGKVFFLAGVVCLGIACFLPIQIGVFLWMGPILIACGLSYGYSSRIQNH